MNEEHFQCGGCMANVYADPMTCGECAADFCPCCWRRHYDPVSDEVACTAPHLMSLGDTETIQVLLREADQETARGWDIDDPLVKEAVRRRDLYRTGKYTFHAPPVG